MKVYRFVGVMNTKLLARKADNPFSAHTILLVAENYYVFWSGVVASIKKIKYKNGKQTQLSLVEWFQSHIVFGWNLFSLSLFVLSSYTLWLAIKSPESNFAATLLVVWLLQPKLFRHINHCRICRNARYFCFNSICCCFSGGRSQQIVCTWKLNAIRKVCSAHFFLYSLAVSRSIRHTRQRIRRRNTLYYCWSVTNTIHNANYILYIAFACKSITSLLIRIKIDVQQFAFFSHSHLCSLNSNNKWLIVVYATANKLNQIRKKKYGFMCE